MKIKTKKIKSVPQWAVNYLMYGSVSDLTADDMMQVDDWISRLRRRGLVFIEPIAGTENAYDTNPAFGLHTATVTCLFVVSGRNVTRRSLQAEGYTL